MAVKRISFNQMNAEHLYEYLCMYWRDDTRRKHGGCRECWEIGTRLEKFIGPAAVRRIEKLVKTAQEKT